MVRISAGELQRQWGKMQDIAIAEPVTVTCNGRDRMVLLSSDEYQRLKRRDREVLTLDDFTEEDLRAIRAAESPPETAQFNHELDD
jgi:PHD/YefM family antitoxin component YafN of YafNO toxin-antitoxin module